MKEGTSITRKDRISILAKHGSIKKAVLSGELSQYQAISLSEALILGLINQEVRTFIGVFGHGSTEIGEVLRAYEEGGFVRTIPVRNEIEASHIAAAMKWKYKETSAVFTSIGPGALQAMSASLTPLSNSLGVYYLMGDETTHGEGPNMQQIPRREQELFLRLASVLGPASTLHTPEAVTTALKRGNVAVNSSGKQTPYYILLPMNVQPFVMDYFNLFELPEKVTRSTPITVDEDSYSQAVESILNSEKTCVKIGGGASDILSSKIIEFLELSDSVFVHGPNVPGVIPSSHKRNMTVGGSKGSISGNYALEECDLLIVIGARGVCQWDSSGTAFPNAKKIININVDSGDLMQYNRTLGLQGDAEAVLERLILKLKERIQTIEKEDSAWLRSCHAKRQEWELYKAKRFDNPVIFDEKWQKNILTQPGAVKIAVDFADSVGALKFFDAGDVQANGFQIVHDEIPGQTITDTGASYMGFAVSAILACSLAGGNDYPIAFTGDGSFMMNPQILIDAASRKLKGMIVLFDNRRMAAISSLQIAQYGCDYKTDDQVVVEYSDLASSVCGVKGFKTDNTAKGLRETLQKAFEYEGLSLVHVPVYFGDDELGSLGSFGSWNVGSWCKDVQERKHQIGL